MFRPIWCEVLYVQLLSRYITHTNVNVGPNSNFVYTENVKVQRAKENLKWSDKHWQDCKGFFKQRASKGRSGSAKGLTRSPEILSLIWIKAIYLALTRIPNDRAYLYRKYCHEILKKYYTIQKIYWSQLSGPR